MKRPQRHLAVLLAVVALSVWWPVPLALATLLLTVVMLAAGRQHFVARALMGELLKR